MKDLLYVKSCNTLKTEKIGMCLWRLLEDCRWHIGRLIYAGKLVSFEIVVPKGFITDGASCPSVLFAICPPMGGAHAEAAVLHDYLYSLDSDLSWNRKESDHIFYLGMLADGTGYGRARIIYSGVRLGGRGSYKKCHSIDKLNKANDNPEDWYFHGGDH